MIAYPVGGPDKRWTWPHAPVTARPGHDLRSVPRGAGEEIERQSTLRRSPPYTGLSAGPGCGRDAPNWRIASNTAIATALARFKLRASGRIGIRSARSALSLNQRSGRPRVSGPKTRASPGPVDGVRIDRVALVLNYQRRPRPRAASTSSRRSTTRNRGAPSNPGPPGGGGGRRDENPAGRTSQSVAPAATQVRPIEPVLAAISGSTRTTCSGAGRRPSGLFHGRRRSRFAFSAAACVAAWTAPLPDG